MAKGIHTFVASLEAKMVAQICTEEITLRVVVVEVGGGAF